ncbi:MAG: translation initiation factor IF-2, partial [Spirochaetia bacterium]|nr:translation initiation factor IF-2 [Spirochaetia bacterium]
PGDVIARLMKMGEMVTINHILDADTATLLAGEFGCEVKVVSLYDETVIEAEEDLTEGRLHRPPVVTIMGHVDHGKTKLLDTIRKSNVVAGEAGAITQHIGAYQVTIPRGKITFLDTPGHEAFTAMRARGAAVTDLVVLVVAADDGVKEQTLEAITHAKEANVPIVVAINKIDLPAANPDRVKQELSQRGLQPEEWGGSTIFCPISAKEGKGIDELLELILLQAEVLDLRANANLRAVGRVIEARIDPGKGPVATVLVQKGTLREGDPYVVGVFSGRVRAMFDDHGHKMTEAGPACPVEITGIDGVPSAGDPFQAVVNEKYGREIAAKRQHYKQITDAATRAQPTLVDLKNWLSDHKELKVIIKADVQGSVEAIRDGLLKLSTDDVKVRVISGATGAIKDSDVNLAAASNAVIVAFQVRPTPQAQDLAEHLGVEIKTYSIIYNVIEEIKAAMEGLLEPDKVEEISGRAEVREVFRISRVGNVAGCMVISGKVRRANKARLIRGGTVIYTGTLKSLKRVKDDASEVAEGFECGIAIDGYNDLQMGDQIESFEVKEVARKL